TLDYKDSFDQSLPLNFSTGLPLLSFEASATASVTASAELKSSFSISLGGLQAVLNATGPAPSNGQLTGDAHFKLAVGSGSPVAVPVAASSTQNNQGVADLVNDLNAALASAGFGGLVVASQSGGVLALTGVNGQAIQVTAAANDPAATELHLPNAAAG